MIQALCSLVWLAQPVITVSSRTGGSRAVKKLARECPAGPHSVEGRVSDGTLSLYEDPTEVSGRKKEVR